MEKLALSVKGMSCNGCEQRVETSLARLEGVARASADHTTETVEVVLDPARTSEAEVRKRIEFAGFEVVTA